MPNKYFKKPTQVMYYTPRTGWVAGIAYKTEIISAVSGEVLKVLDVLNYSHLCGKPCAICAFQHWENIGNSIYFQHWR